MISIIVPVYQVEKYLAKCIDSILVQTHQDFELILVNDGSTDNSGNICDAYAQKDARIKVVHKENGGLSSARNAGIDVATGKYLVFIDSDDYLAEDMVDTLYKAIVENCAEMALCNFCYVDEQGKELPERNQVSPIKDEVIDSYLAMEKMSSPCGGWYYVTAWNKLYQRSLFDAVRFPEGKLHEDEFVVHQLFCQCNKIACVKKNLYFYVQRNASIMNQTYSIKRLDAAEAYAQRTQFFLEEGFGELAMKAFSAALSVLFTCCGQINCKTEENFARIQETKELLKKICYNNWKVFIRKTTLKEKIKVLIFLLRFK